MNKIKRILPIILILMVFTSCKPQEDVYVPVKETGREAGQAETNQVDDEHTETESTELDKVKEKTEEKPEIKEPTPVQEPPVVEEPIKIHIKITEDAVNIRSYSDLNSEILMVAKVDQEFVVIEKVKDTLGEEWYKIEIPGDERQGYVLASFTKEMEGLNNEGN